MRIILDTDNEQNFVDLWNPEKNNWERYIKCEKKETKPLNEEDKKIEKIEYSIDKDGYLSVNDFREHLLQIINKINEIIDYINGGTNGE